MKLFASVAARCVALGALFVASQTGCGDDPKSIPASEVVAAQAAAFCAQAAVCAEPDAEIDPFPLLAQHSPDGCAALLLKSDPPNITAWLDAGLIKYDGEKAAECVDALANQCLSALQGTIPACDEAVVGLVPPGGACEDGVVCAGDAWCEKTDSDCPGVCKAYIAIGEACDQANFGFDCSRASGSATCDSETSLCTLLPARTTRTAATGEACGWIFTDGQSVDVTCPANHVCTDAGDDTDDVCRPIVAVGGDCTAPGVCALGSACVQAESGPTCQSIAITDVAGGPCNVTDFTKPAVMCNAFNRLICSSNGTCEATTGTNGSKCDREVVPCNEGFFCDGTSSTCKSTKSDGSDCSSDSECISDYCSVEGKCDQRVCQ